MERISLGTLPCTMCIHKAICPQKENLMATEVRSDNPYIRVTVNCTQYYPVDLTKSVLRASVKETRYEFKSL